MALQPLIKVLTASGTGSRRQMTAAIKRGGVKVNSRIVENFNEPVNPENDVVIVDGKHIDVKMEPHIYLMLNKPRGVVSSTRDERGGKTVNDIIPAKYHNLRIYPVGRLDKDSTGLILLTNDGNLTYRLTHPRFEQEKEYLVRIDTSLQPEEINRLEDGIDIKEGKTAPARIRTVKSGSQYPGYDYSIIIHEGKKRQVRRMLAVLGYSVIELKRIRFSSLKLGTLPEGRVRELTPGEVRLLKSESGDKT
jgi:23S rRNA pseudouridine2605 synthase